MHMVAREQWHATEKQRMSTVLWDTFTGSAPYKQIFLSSIHPSFIFWFTRHLVSVVLAKLSPRRIWSERVRKKSSESFQQG